MSTQETATLDWHRDGMYGATIRKVFRLTPIHALREDGKTLCGHQLKGDTITGTTQRTAIDCKTCTKRAETLGWLPF